MNRCQRSVVRAGRIASLPSGRHALQRRVGRRPRQRQHVLAPHAQGIQQLLEAELGVLGVRGTMRSSSPRRAPGRAPAAPGAVGRPATTLSNSVTAGTLLMTPATNAPGPRPGRTRGPQPLCLCQAPLVLVRAPGILSRRSRAGTPVGPGTVPSIPSSASRSCWMRIWACGARTCCPCQDQRPIAARSHVPPSLVKRGDAPGPHDRALAPVRRGRPAKRDGRGAGRRRRSSRRPPPRRRPRRSR